MLAGKSFTEISATETLSLLAGLGKTEIPVATLATVELLKHCGIAARCSSAILPVAGDTILVVGKEPHGGTLSWNGLIIAG